MEVYKRYIGYSNFGRNGFSSITSTTLNFPIFLKSNFDDMGIFTDTDNTVESVSGLFGTWDLSGSGSSEKPCTNLNNCSVSFVETPITSFGGSDGSLSAIITSCSPQSIFWSGPNGFTSTDVTINGLSSGVYTLKITDVNCDVTYSSYVLQQPQGLSASLTTINSQKNATSGCNGSATAFPQGGSPPYNYLWYSGVTSNSFGSLSAITGLCAGSYTVRITDSSGTIVSSVFAIAQPATLSGYTVYKTNISCSGGKTGEMKIQGIGGYLTTGYTYVATGPTPSTNLTGLFTNLSAGTYNVQIIDNAYSTFNLPVTISQPVTLTYGYSTTDVTCYGDSSGQIAVTPVGGSGTYNLSLEKTLPFVSAVADVTVSGPYTFTGLDAGVYSLSIIDSKGCVGPTTSITVSQSPIFNMNITTPSLSVGGYNITCYGDSIVITATTSYTSGSYTTAAPSSNIEYYVNNVYSGTCFGAGCSVPLTLPAGTYAITAVDGTECSATTVVTLTQSPAQLSIVGGVDLIYSDSSSCAPPSADCRQGIVDVNGGVGPYTITWIADSTAMGTGTTSNPFSIAVYSTIHAIITDANGCSITGSTAL